MTKAVRASPNERPSYEPAVVSEGTLRAACAGDDAAFAHLVRTYYPHCLRFAQHLTGSAEDAEECVQDTFVRVHRALPKYQERGQFKAWLFYILANRCRTARSRARRNERIRVTLLRARRTATSFEYGLPIGEFLAQAFQQLSDDLREAFLLRHVDGFSYEQISTITGVAITAARMRVSRAGAQLRAALGP
jgi:RNA polymerase sigma-70 factor, ECF subfamily